MGQKPFFLLSPKWELTVSMDFIIEFPMNMRQHDPIMVVVDKITNESHFIPVNSTHKDDSIAKIFMKDIFRLHHFLIGIPSLLPIFGKVCLHIWVQS